MALGQEVRVHASGDVLVCGCGHACLGLPRFGIPSIVLASANRKLALRHPRLAGRP
jgi:hypothetical protein